MYTRGEYDTIPIVVARVLTVQLATILGLENWRRNPEIELVQALHPQNMYARGEYVTKKMVAPRVLTVQLATIFDPAAILKLA